MLLALALIPVIALLVFIYFKDKNEKEPVGLLVGLFFAGLGTIITAVIIELIGEVILNLIIPYDSMVKAVLLAMIVVGPAEEFGKYMVLRLITWKSKQFNYSYDAIVYAVFVSLGFAAIENVGYVFQNGWGTAVLRMFTAIPGHASFAVFMGYFYSKAKYAYITKNQSAYHKYNALSLVIPMVLHGIYDGIVFAAQASDDDAIGGIGALIWIGFVIALFVMSFITVHKSAKNDYCIVNLPNQVQTIYRPQIIGNWTCSCGTVNGLNFCKNCGKARPVSSTWKCPKCETLSTFNFCGNCGCPRPIQQLVQQVVPQPMQQPVQQVPPTQPPLY